MAGASWCDSCLTSFVEGSPVCNSGGSGACYVGNYYNSDGEHTSLHLFLIHMLTREYLLPESFCGLASLTLP